MSYGSISHILWHIRIQCCHRRALRQTVTLHGDDADIVKELQNCRINGCAARDDDSHSAAEHCQNLFRERFADVQADFLGLSIHSQKPGQKLFLALCSDIFPNLLI